MGGDSKQQTWYIRKLYSVLEVDKCYGPKAAGTVWGEEGSGQASLGRWHLSKQKWEQALCLTGRGRPRLVFSRKCNRPTWEWVTHEEVAGGPSRGGGHPGQAVLAHRLLQTTRKTLGFTLNELRKDTSSSSHLLNLRGDILIITLFGGSLSFFFFGRSLVAKSCLALWDPMTIAHQAPLFMGFPRQEYWSGLPFPSLDLPNPGIKPRSPAWQILYQWATWEAPLLSRE